MWKWLKEASKPTTTMDFNWKRKPVYKHPSLPSLDAAITLPQQNIIKRIF